LLAGTALLAQAQGDLEQACSLVSEAIDFAEQRKMVHMRPLTYLTLGKIQGQQGQVEEGIAHLQTAETAALKMGMRPIAWQARIATAELLQGMGDYAGAQAKQAEAQAMVEEIAGLMTDEELREAYLQSMKGKVMVS